ncbi:MAG: Gfo/Idh/MocA family protein, partial [Pirellulaceae bacterium]
ASVLGIAAATAGSYRRAWGAKERLQVALIGCGGRGTGVAAEFAQLDGVELRYVCDPDASRAAAAAKRWGQATVSSDFRRALDDKSVDAVIVATPDHWHAPAAILSCAAGKHVYVEKPCSHSFREGRWLVDAARRAGVRVQHGTQSRSIDLIHHGVQLLREGAIGKVLVAKAWNVQQRPPIGRASPSQPPSGVDYDLWVGPAPFLPYQSNRFHYTWHWWYNFGTGDMGNDGVHEIDIARWGLGVDTHPSTIQSIGSKYAYDDDQQFPDTQFAIFDYPGDGHVGSKRQLQFEMRLWSRYGLEGIDNGNAFYGTDGWMLLSKRGVLKLFDERNRPREVPGSPPRLSSHFQNFADAVRGRGTLRAEIEVGHLSAALCHLANVSARLGRTLHFDPTAERVDGDDEAQQMLARTYRDGHWAAPPSV